MNETFIHRMLFFLVPIVLVMYNALVTLWSLLTTKIPYQHLLATFSFLTLSCGGINLIGQEPYTFHLIFIGLIGLFLSIARPFMQISKLGFLLLYHATKKEKVS